MNTKVLIALCLVVIGFALFVVFTDKGDITNYPPKFGPIAAFGDSLVKGVGASEGKDFVTLLSSGIGEEIINFGVSGNTTADALARINTVLEIEPRIVLVLLGGNDFLRRVPREETFSNLKMIINKLQASGAVVVLLGVRGGLLSDSADGLFKNLARETGSVYVPNVLDGLFGDQQYMSDAIHPNDAGYRRIAEKVYPVLKELAP